MTATKAFAGGVSGAMVVIADWLLTTIPGWDQIPAQPQGAIAFLVSAGIGFACVYWAPSNKVIVNRPASDALVVE
jgi:hypothetical protein